MSILHKYVLLTGDFNAGIQTLDNFLDADDFLARHFDFDASMQEFYNASSILPIVKMSRNRISNEKTTNNGGRLLLEVCKSSNLFILDDRCGKDKGIGSFTFKNLSIIGYSIGSSQFLKFVSDFEIVKLDSLYTNDHYLLCTTLNFGNVLQLAKHKNVQKKVADPNGTKKNQRTNGPVNAHLISWPSKA